MSPTFTYSDAWLLHAASYGSIENGITLANTIGAGDGINRAIFTPQELRRGFAKLIGSGYMEFRDGRFFVSPSGRSLTDAARMQTDSTIGRTKLMLTALGGDLETHEDPNYEDPHWPFPEITDEAVENAYLANHESFLSFSKKFKDGDAT